MKTSILKYIVSLLFSFLAISCGDFEQVIEVELETGDPFIVINTLAVDTANQLLVDVQRSKTIYENSEVVYLNEATVSVTDLQTNQTTLCSFNDNSKKFVAPFVAVPGKKYRIQAAYNDMQTASAEFTMPPKPIITNYEFQETETEYNSTNRISFALKDQSGRHFYRIYVESSSVTYIKETAEILYDNKERMPVGFYTDDPILRGGYSTGDFFNFGGDQYEYYNAAFFSDENFSELSHTFRLYVDSYGYYYKKKIPTKTPITVVEERTYHVYVQGITESYYQYYNTLLLQRENSGSPFSEPVQVYTNVENGAGIVGGTSIVEYTFSSSFEYESDTDYYDGY